MIRPAPGVARAEAYQVPSPGAPTDLKLDGNEGGPPPVEWFAWLERHGGDIVRHYPDYRPLESLLAERSGVPAERLLLAAGADDALDRACRALLEPGREMILPVPTFELIERYAQLAGATVVPVPWPSGPYPVDAVLQEVNERTAIIVVVSPNNPTGAAATVQDVLTLSSGAPDAIVMLDLAYAEFADEDLAGPALELPNMLCIRTLSKAWGLAGLRIGYAIGPPGVIRWMRSAGAPYGVAGPSAALALERLTHGGSSLEAFVAEVRRERHELEALLQRLGVDVFPSQGNFSFARFRNRQWVWEGLAGLGIAVRAFPTRQGLQDVLRITCPGHRDAFQRLQDALQAVMAPQALLFDMDGVLADVSGSYRQCILETAAALGVRLQPEEIAAAKVAGGANNDWDLTRRLVGAHGVDVPLQVVKERFETLYQGTDGAPGLRHRERLLCEVDLFRRLSARMPLGVVTGRPRSDCQRFLADAGLQGCMAASVCMEDGPLKPDPAPVRLALDRLGIARAWMVGDTPDDIRAARRAGVVPIGIVPPGDDPERVGPALVAAGAARVLSHLAELEALIP